MTQYMCRFVVQRLTVVMGTVLCSTALVLWVSSVTPVCKKDKLSSRYNDLAHCCLGRSLENLAYGVEFGCVLAMQYHYALLVFYTGLHPSG